MLTLIKAFLERIDFLSIAEATRKSKNRQLSARLFVILSQSYEIIEIYRILLNELRAGLNDHRRTDDKDRFFLNPGRISSLLSRQASNLEVMETLVSDLLAELQIIAPQFADTYRSLFPGKFGILFEAQHFLNSARFPISEGDFQNFPANSGGEHKALWFTWNSPSDDERTTSRQSVYCNVTDPKLVLDVNIHDRERFFEALDAYFEGQNPFEKLREIEEITECYRKALLENFDVGDLLTDIAKVRRHYCWADPA